MKLHPEDPRLTAFLLGELPADEAAAVERTVAEDPALQAAVREIEVIRNLLTETLVPKSVTLHPGQREQILRAAKSDKIAPLNVRRKSWQPWIMPLAAAAVITLIAVFLTQKTGGNKQAANPPLPPAPVREELPRPNIKLLPAPGPVDPGKSATAGSKAALASASNLPPLRTRSYLAAADFPTLDLPVQSGKSSLDWIRKSIITNHEMPDRNAVRLEEILNSFQLRPVGMTVVARLPATGWHPDGRENGMTSHAATIATETLACPWKPSATLVLISIRGNPYSDCQIKAVFRANSSNVRRYRLLGFAPAEGQDNTPLPSLLPAKSSNTLVIEVEPSAVAGELGAIEWSVNGQSAAPVALTRHGDTEPSDDARFAALVCTYAQWLTNDQNGMIDTELLAALAREIASASLSGDRSEFLNLIDQSLNL